MDHRAQVTNVKDEVPWRAATLQLILDLGKLFVSLRAKAEAEMWISTLEKELEETIALVNGDAGSLRVSDCLDTLTVEYCRLKLLENDEPTESRFRLALVLGEKMLAACHIETEQCHYLAIAWAKKLYPENPSIRIDIQLRTQHLFENIQRRIPAAVANLTDLLFRPNINEVAKNIEMLETFERMHLHITLPSTKRALLSLQNILYATAGRHRNPGTTSDEFMELSLRMPTVNNIRRETSNIEANEQTLKARNILDRQATDDSHFNLLYYFFSRPLEITSPKLLKNLLVEESACGVLNEQAIAQLFGIEDITSNTTREEILKLKEQELLEKLVGTPELPLHGREWIPRRAALRDWLLDESRPDFPLRQCLWVALHNARLRAWRERCIEGIWQKEFDKAHDTKGDGTDWTKDLVTVLRSYAPGIFRETRELIDAVEERLGLKEAKLGYGLDHFERETHLARSGLSRLYTALFFYSRVPGEEPSEACTGYLDHAEKNARDQLAHWRSVSNYQWIATEAVAIANIAQYRIECRIIKEAPVINRTLEEALALLEEVETLFGTTLYEVDLSHSLVTLQMKVYMGTRMDIWTVGNIATRLLLHATQIIQDKTQGNESEEAKAEHENKLMRLWQWVQRVKARALAQSMGLDNVVPDSMLVEIQNSINDDTLIARKELGISSDSADPDDEVDLAKRLEAVKLEATSIVHLELLPEVRQFMRESNSVIPKMDLDLTTQETSLRSKEHFMEVTSSTVLEEAFSVSRDLQTANLISEKLKRMDNSDNGNTIALQEELSSLKQKIATKPALHRLLTIADFLNREEVLLKSIKDGPPRDLFQRRIDLQRLRNEMRSEPLLYQMLRIREGWPLSNEDLHKIAEGRKGKAVFVDWFTATSSFNQTEKVYMLVWRNGVCKLVDLATEVKSCRQDISDFFNNKELYLPDVDLTNLANMDLEHLVPKSVFGDDPQPVENCMELIQPLFDDSLVEDEDLLVLSVTEGFQNFPLHAIEDGKNGPLILHHPVVYVPSLSVLHKCYWARHTSNKIPNDNGNDTLRSLILGGIVSTEPAFQYGVTAVERIGNIVKSPETFVGADATLDNFCAHISSSDLMHIHLHTNYDTEKKSKASAKQGYLSENAEEDTAFVDSPLDQALVFNDLVKSNNQLTARQIIEMQPAKGAHLNLIACASGRQGKFDVSFDKHKEVVTDEVMGLVPAFLFSGVGSVTSTLWPIKDEHGAVFSHIFFRELMDAKEVIRCLRKERTLRDVGGGDETNWVDLAEVHRKAVLEMRRIYKQPSAWAGFILSGFWKFEIC